MWAANENPGSVGALHGANIRSELSQFAATRARNQATLARVFGIPAKSPYTDHRLAALRRRGIRAEHARVIIPLQPGHDPLGAALEVADPGTDHTNAVAHLVIDFQNGTARFAEIAPHWCDVDFIGRLDPDAGRVILAVGLRAWLLSWRFEPSNQPDGHWTCWPGAVLLVKQDDRALRRLTSRIAGTNWRVCVIGDKPCERRIAERLKRFAKPATPTFALAGTP